MSLNEDNLIFRALLSHSAILGLFRLFSIIVMALLVIASIVLLIRFLGSAELNLWGLAIKSETRNLEAALKLKDDTIERLQQENKQLQTTLNTFTEVIESTRVE